MTDSLAVETILDGRYRLVRLLKRGGMGEIYAAEHTETLRKVAIKVLRDPYSRDPAARERFRREAQATSRLTHEHIVDILDYGVCPDGTCYLVMELLYGEDLQATLRREARLPARRAVTIILQICAALAEAHANGIVHRDLKPANIFRIGFRGVEDFVKLVDFGIAKQIAQVDESDGEDDPLTRVGAVLGTIYYMPPEQATGGDIDHRADVFATGVLLYQLLTGRLPFKGATPQETYRLILDADPPPVRQVAPDAGLPDTLDQLFKVALAKNPDERLPSMEAFAAALRAVMVERRPTGESAARSMVAGRSMVGSAARSTVAGAARSMDTGAARSMVATTVEPEPPPPSSRGPLIAGVALGLTLAVAAALAARAWL